MARPHILFVQAQMIPWTRGLHGDESHVVESQMLIRDADGREVPFIFGSSAITCTLPRAGRLDAMLVQVRPRSLL